MTTKLNSHRISNTVIWVSVLLNILFCCTLLPILIHPTNLFSGKELLETIYWQIIYLISWPIGLISGLLNIIGEGPGTKFTDLLITLIYPAGMGAVLSLVLSKRRNWISVIVLHLSLLLSFFSVWKAVLTGYDFMIG